MGAKLVVAGEAEIANKAKDAADAQMAEVLQKHRLEEVEPGALAREWKDAKDAREMVRLQFAAEAANEVAKKTKDAADVKKAEELGNAAKEAVNMNKATYALMDNIAKELRNATNQANKKAKITQEPADERRTEFYRHISELANRRIARKQVLVNTLRDDYNEKSAHTFWALEFAKDTIKTNKAKGNNASIHGLTFCASDAIPCQYAEQLGLFRKQRNNIGNDSMLFCKIHDCDHVRSCLNLYADELNRIRPNLGEHIRHHPLTAASTSGKAFIFGAGAGSTGTSSLTVALQKLGLKVLHSRTHEMAEELHMAMGGLSDIYELHKQSQQPRALLSDHVRQCVRFLRTFKYTNFRADMKNADALLDDPNQFVFLDFFLSFPNAKVLLTSRPPKQWAARRWTHIHKDGPANGPVPILEPCKMTLRYNLYNFTQQDIAHMYAMTNEVIRCIAPKEQFFEINIFTMNTTIGLMSSLAKFLGLQTNHTDKMKWPRENTDGQHGWQAHR
eukprot:gnl/TRDRNA2_/TRDRNA2_174472_c2_seq1.p1 gnl/TRDRNA2_/TRDRNA2_174472_c2~~gnl/TRDRNA2_/TRDRNA2_174472_c2_seq1.p1  ORF type:complete len:576 (+),score=83.04 gnl/TRDRNA2_/TRDRNA2_174472_c2_seq1:221-1729(+)